MIHLHNYSTFSFLQAYGLPSQIIAAAKENEQTAIAITDRAGMSGLVPFYKEAKEAGIKPILGAEIFLVKSIKGDGKKEAKHNLVLLAKDEKGYSNLCKLVTTCAVEGFYYTPTGDYELLQDHFEGLIALSGELEGAIPKFLLANDLDKATQMIKAYKKMFGEDFYIEVSPNPSMPNKKLVELAKLHKVKFVATGACRFPRREDFTMFQIMDCIGKKKTMDDYLANAHNEDNALKYQMGEAEMSQALKAFGLSNQDIKQAIEESDRIGEKINSALPKASSLKFKGKNKEIELQKVIAQGWKDRGLHKLPKAKRIIYKKRLQKEWKLIIEKDYLDYFLIVQDLVNWAKNSGIMVGHARGSAAGSLICWLTKITEIDPIPHGLFFERFIDINRFDPPDIDIDFEDDRRDEVKKYLVEKYGKKKVAAIGTIMYYKGRICFDDLRRIYNLPSKDVETLKDLVIERTGGDSRASFTIEDTFKQFPQAEAIAKKYPQLRYASQLEAQARQKGVHAAGVIIGNDDVSKYLPISFRNDQLVADVDKKVAEEMGFLKLDLLGLNYLSILNSARKLVKQRHGVDIDYYNLPTEDEGVYKMFKRGKLFGVFQFEGEAVAAICQQSKPSNFKELIDISALSRPGALHSGGTSDYIRYKADPKKIEYIHPIMQELAEDTFGTIIYQEQVMTIMRKIGNMSWKDTSEIRRLISKTMGEEYFNTFKVKFMKGAVEENKIPEHIAEEIWKHVCTFGAFAFNKSHTVSYTYISYACMYMKVHYPLEYYSCLCEQAQEWKLNKIVREFKKEGGTMLFPDVNKSKIGFRIEGDAIRAGFQNVKGIGDITAQKIIAGQPYHTIEDFKSRSKASKKVVETLMRIGALNGLERKQGSLFGESWAEPYKHEPTIYDLIACFPYGVDLDLIGNFKEKAEEMLGFRVDLYTIEEIIERQPEGDVCTIAMITKRDLRNINELSNRSGQPVKHPELSEYVQLTIEDDTGFLPTTVSRYIYGDLKEKIWQEEAMVKDAVFLIQGGYVAHMGRMYINNLICLNK